MDRHTKKMLRLAKKARSHSYSPYSKFKVGACIYTTNKKYFVGTNVENSAYPESTCAEANAIGAMITDGCRKIDSILIIGKKHTVTSPCGGCRQRLAEFATKRTKIYLVNDKEEIKTLTIDELLPNSFKLNAKK